MQLTHQHSLKSGGWPGFEPGSLTFMASALSEDIEVRLLRLKFFPKTWCRDPSQRTAIKVETHLVAESPEIVINSPDTSPIAMPIGTSQSSSSPVPRSPTPTTSVQKLSQSLPSCNCMVNTHNLHIGTFVQVVIIIIPNKL